MPTLERKSHSKDSIFLSDSGGPVNFIPPSNVTLELDDIETDKTGYFKTTVKIPNRPSEDAQKIETIMRRAVGNPHLTQTAYDTWDKIIETIFLALLATTIGTALSIPISFFAARNLMKEIVSNLIGLISSGYCYSHRFCHRFICGQLDELGW